MKGKFVLPVVLVLGVLIGNTHAATFTVTTAASNGAGSFSQAIRDADASADLANTIRFNIPGAGPHYIAPPVGGFPLVTKDNTTIDGYSQPGSSANTRPITQTNDAVIKIVLDARAPNNNFRDMAYVYYGSQTVSDPVIDNSAMYVGVDMSRERGGYDPRENGDTGHTPYTPGEVAILAIYRATNVTVKGLAFLGDGINSAAALLSEYAIAVAQDYGLDTAVKDRFAYDAGSSRGFHLSGCWIGYDPVTRAEHLSVSALSAFRHRDKGTGGTRPELPNLENFSIGVKPKSTNPRAQFNVLGALNLIMGAEGMRCQISGNQFLGDVGVEIGRYDDTQVPSIVYGTDGDGVNDAEEGNLFPATAITPYSTGNKVHQIAGNIFGLARDGTRTMVGMFAASSFGFNNRTKVRFGSNLDGLNDGVEANTLYDSFGFSADATAPDNNAWFSMRGNSLVNNLTLPLDEAVGQNLYNKFIDTTAANPITPVISAATTASLTGTCGIPLPGVASVVVDIYESDAEGDTNAIPQGKVYRGSFADNSAADSNPAVGAFNFNIAGLGISSGAKLTITANYLKAEGRPTITSVARSGDSTTLTITGGNGPFSILRAPAVGGPYTSFTTAASSPATFADAAATSFYDTSSLSGGGQTSPFAPSVTVP